MNNQPIPCSLIIICMAFSRKKMLHVYDGLINSSETKNIHDLPSHSLNMDQSTTYSKQRRQPSFANFHKSPNE